MRTIKNMKCKKATKSTTIAQIRKTVAENNAAFTPNTPSARYKEMVGEYYGFAKKLKKW